MSAILETPGAAASPIPHVPTAIYADGGVIGRNPSPLGGTWAWCQVAGDEFLCGAAGTILPIDVGAAVVTNNVTEYFALAKALRYLPDGWSGPVYSDSQITLGRFFWGWKNEQIPPRWQQALRVQLARLGTLDPVLLDGHPTRAQLAAGIGKRGNPVSRWNCWCDEQCRRQAEAFMKERTCQKQA